MLTKNAAIEIVDNYAREIQAQGVHLRTVILYGSHAKGTQNQWSDIDVALVADEFEGLPTDIHHFMTIAIKKPYTRIEPNTFPTDYFYEGDPFIEEIIKTGIKII